MRRLLLALSTTVVLACVAAAPATAASVPREEPLAVLLGDHAVYATPDRDGDRIASLTETRPLTGQRTAVPLVAQRVAAGGGRWLRVRLPGRPNGRTGWISAQATSIESTPWRIVVELRKRRVLVYEDGHRVRTYSAIVGKSSTPTPQGRFFVEETVRMNPDEGGAPWALATSARSDALEHFEGGVGQIALHGTDNLTGTLGTPASHGCVRLRPADITWLAARIGPGVPITVTAR